MDNRHDNPEPPRDILAAEAFAMGAGDPGLHREPAHDVLAADEFPLPAAAPHALPPEWQMSPSSGEPDSHRRARALAAALLLGALLLAVRRRRRRG